MRRSWRTGKEAAWCPMKKVRSARKMSRTFELSQDGRQFDETLRIDNGRSKTPIVIRYVFDAIGLDTQREQQDSDPNRPVLKRTPSDGGGSPQ